MSPSKENDFRYHHHQTSNIYTLKRIHYIFNDIQSFTEKRPFIKKGALVINPILILNRWVGKIFAPDFILLCIYMDGLKKRWIYPQLGGWVHQKK